MAVSIDQFIRHLLDSRLMSDDEIGSFCRALPSQPETVEKLAGQLVRANKLTKYQAGRIFRGKTAGLVLGNYEILDKLGEGGMGQVFSARHRRMDRLVALKVLSPRVSKDPNTVKRFLREVKAAARLQHPHIVTAHDADESGGIHFLVMEHVNGRDLSQFVKDVGPLPVRHAVECILQAAQGLSYAHGEGVIHRDIKPSNLLLDDRGRVKILDMGLARLDSLEADAETDDALTETGAVMGTIDYMAPEQAADAKTADARSDIYSLGCTLHFLLTGRAVFQAATVVSRIMAHRDQPIPSLCEARPDASVELEAIFQKMLAKDKLLRYQSMAKVIADLESLGLVPSSPDSLISAASPTDNDSKLVSFLAGLSRKSTATKTKTEKKTEKQTRLTADTHADASIEATLTMRDTQGLAASMPAAAPQATRKPSRRLLIAGGVAAFAVVLGIIITIINRDGTTTSVDVPPGSDVKVDDKGNVKVKLPGTNTNEKPPVTGNNPASAVTSDYALSFDGKDDYVEVPSLRFDGKHPVTIEAWARTTSPQAMHAQVVNLGERIQIIRRKPPFDSWVLNGIDSGGSFMKISDRAANSNDAVHVAGVLDGREMRLYINGVLQQKPIQHLDNKESTTSKAGDSIKVQIPPSKPDVGSQIGTRVSAGNFFHGIIDEVRISKTARYTKDFTPAKRFTTDKDTLILG